MSSSVRKIPASQQDILLFIFSGGGRLLQGHPIGVGSQPQEWIEATSLTGFLRHLILKDLSNFHVGDTPTMMGTLCARVRYDARVVSRRA